jgi:hypothetical protein
MLNKRSFGRTDGLAITSITTSETAVGAALRGGAAFTGPCVLLAVRATNDVGAGAKFNVRGYTDASKTVQLFDVAMDLSAAADQWASTHFTQPIPLLRGEALNITAEADGGSGHGLSVTVDYEVADVI